MKKLLISVSILILSTTDILANVVSNWSNKVIECDLQAAINGGWAREASVWKRGATNRDWTNDPLPASTDMVNSSLGIRNGRNNQNLRVVDCMFCGLVNRRAGGAVTPGLGFDNGDIVRPNGEPAGQGWICDRPGTATIGRWRRESESSWGGVQTGIRPEYADLEVAVIAVDEATTTYKIPDTTGTAVVTHQVGGGTNMPQTITSADLQSLRQRVDSAGDSRAYRHADGTFNWLRLGVNLGGAAIVGTAAGVLTNRLVASSQINKGQENIQCVYGGGGQATAYGATFMVQ